jgi:hypothetical protein
MLLDQERALERVIGPFRRRKHRALHQRLVALEHGHRQVAPIAPSQQDHAGAVAVERAREHGDIVRALVRIERVG